MVSVLPTHRRRGILRSLMHRQLADIAARGAGADRGAVGLGDAAVRPVRVRAGVLARVLPVPPRRGRARPVSAGRPGADARGWPSRRTSPGTWPRSTTPWQPRQPGFFARDDDWWERVLDDPEEDRHGASPLRCLLAADADGVRGYALYRAVARWDRAPCLPDSGDQRLGAGQRRPGGRRGPLARPAQPGPGHRDHRRPAAGRRPAALPAARPAPGPACRWPTTSGCGSSTCPRALTRRAYAGPVDVVLEVTDELLPANAGRWRLRAAGADSDGAAGAASCTTDRRPGRHRARRQGTGRGLPRRHPARRARRGRPGHRAAAGHAGAAVRRHDLGPGPLVPADLLGHPVSKPSAPGLAGTEVLDETGEMRITLSGAMRARDVSRPSDEQLAAAAEARGSSRPGGRGEPGPRSAARAGPARADAPDPIAAADRSPRPPRSRRPPRRIRPTTGRPRHRRDGGDGGGAEAARRRRRCRR